MRFLFKDHTHAIPIRPLHLVLATLEGLQPTIDVSPEEVEAVKNAIIRICKDVSKEYKHDYETGPLISNAAFAKRLRLEADITDDIILESELRALAILVEESL